MAGWNGHSTGVEGDGGGRLGWIRGKDWAGRGVWPITYGTGEKIME